ncbi:MAG: hypothetical protein C4531_06225 [Desulfurivibrio sp.]|jgi:hypothetical protein|nr:MAG: hypothetical protein C4531_06225 [Desulfurivibrio sp.]
MHTRETSFSESREAETKARSLAGARNSRIAAAEATKPFADDFDSTAGDIVAGEGDIAAKDIDAGELAAEELAADEPFVREDYLRYQIDKLTARIESGYSDRKFELWSQHRDSIYVTNDRELLARYEKELREMENKE